MSTVKLAVRLMALGGLSAAIIACAATAHAAPQAPAAAPQRPLVPVVSDVIPTTAAKTLTGTATVSGTVVDDLGAPIRGGTVYLWTTNSEVNRSATADEEGRFEFRELPAGSYSSSASKAGYLKGAFKQRTPFAPGFPLEVVEGQKRPGVVITLWRAGVIAGQIVDELQEPLEHVGVTVVRYSMSDGEVLPPPATFTDDEGRFRLSNLMPGRYYVLATPRAGTPRTIVSEQTEGDIPTYYPGVADIGSAAPFTVGYGPVNLEARFALVRAKMTEVSGIGIDSRGRLLTRGVVSVLQRLGNSSRTTSTSQVGRDGRFRVTGLAPGTYLLNLVVPGSGPEPPEFGIASVAVDGIPIEDVPITASRAVLVAGRITTGRGVTAKGLIVSSAQVIATPLEAWQSPLSLGFRGSAVGQDSTFSFSQRPGTFRFNLAGLPTGWMVGAVRLNGVDITETGVELRPGRTVDGLEIEITDRVSEIVGTVTDSRGALVGGAPVVVFARDSAAWGQERRVKMRQSDRAGRFAFTGLPAGTYYAVALLDLDPSSATEPEYLQKAVPLSERVTIGDGERLTLSLRAVAIAP